MPSKKVPGCFGKYGFLFWCASEQRCEDCQENLFCKDKRSYPCMVMCEHSTKCSRCFFEWFLKKDQNRTIEEFMSKNKLEFRYGK